MISGEPCLLLSDAGTLAMIVPFFFLFFFFLQLMLTKDLIIRCGTLTGHDSR